MRHTIIADTARARPGHHYYSAAATCLFLATKVEESCRNLKELICACVRVAQKKPDKVVDEQDKEFWKWKDTILNYEDVLLETLTFDLSLSSPYQTLYELLCYLGVSDDTRLRGKAWGFLTDQWITPICVIWSSRTVAAAALYAAARYCNKRFEDDGVGRPWWNVVGVELAEIKGVCNMMAETYEKISLKNGEANPVYSRPPTGEDEQSAETRRRRDLGDEDEIRWGGERRESNDSSVRSDVSKKRPREDEVPNGHAAVGWDDRSPTKRTRMTPSRQITTNGTRETNGRHLLTTASADADGAEGGLVSPSLGGNASEEGELDH